MKCCQNVLNLRSEIKNNIRNKNLVEKNKKHSKIKIRLKPDIGCYPKKSCPVETEV